MTITGVSERGGARQDRSLRRSMRKQRHGTPTTHRSRATFEKITPEANRARMPNVIGTDMSCPAFISHANDAWTAAFSGVQTWNAPLMLASCNAPGRGVDDGTAVVLVAPATEAARQRADRPRSARRQAGNHRGRSNVRARVVPGPPHRQRSEEKSVTHNAGGELRHAVARGHACRVVMLRRPA